MLEIGIQTRNAIDDSNPLDGFRALKAAGFSCVDFSLNSYLRNRDLYQFEKNTFFDKSEAELRTYFAPIQAAANEAGIRVHQMHMPYPNYVPDAPKDLNRYLREVVAPKSLRICAFFGCRYIVIHGFKLARFLGSEEEEWEKTREFPVPCAVGEGTWCYDVY